VGAGEWRVSPIRLDLGTDTRSAVLTVINEGTGRFQAQIKAVLWTQDGEGKDQYADTTDLVFFPRLMVFDKPEERVVRSGIRFPSGLTEKTYRLFIEEIPEPRKSEGTNVAIAIKFGVPIFVKPVKEQPKGEIERVELDKGTLRVTVKNSGNVHFVINSIKVKGKGSRGEETFSRELSGWYLLHGASRAYTTQIAKEICVATVRYDVEAATDRFVLSGRLDADKAMCPQ
jgi:fimbrial chaperone protein